MGLRKSSSSTTAVATKFSVDHITKFLSSTTALQNTTSVSAVPLCDLWPKQIPVRSRHTMHTFLPSCCPRAFQYCVYTLCVEIFKMSGTGLKTWKHFLNKIRNPTWHLRLHSLSYCLIASPLFLYRFFSNVPGEEDRKYPVHLIRQSFFLYYATKIIRTIQNLFGHRNLSDTLHDALQVERGPRAPNVTEMVQHSFRTAKRITVLGPHFYRHW